MRRLGAVAVFVGLIGVLVAPPSWAGASTQTLTVKNATATFPTPNPCSGAPGHVTITYNAVMHVTALDSGGYHETDTTEGTFAFVPNDPSKPSYAGHFMQWEGVNLNSRSTAFTATGSIVGKGSDGSRLVVHEVEHLTGTTKGIVVHFDRPRCS